MTRWPLLLPPPAVSTLPSHLRRSSLSIVVKSPSHRSSPSSCRRAVHCRSTAPSITFNSPLRCPSPPIAVVLSVHRRRAHAVPCRRRAVAPSIAAEDPSRLPLPSRSRRSCQLTTPATRLAPPNLSSGWLSHCLSLRRRLPSASAFHCGHHLLCLLSVRLVVPSPRFSRRHLPSAGASASHRTVASSCHAHLGPLIRLVKASPLLTPPPPPICGITESSQRSSLMLV